MLNFNGLSRYLYKAARISRDLNAIQRGPKAMGKRVLRKAAGRTMGGFINRLFK